MDLPQKFVQLPTMTTVLFLLVIDSISEVLYQYLEIHLFISDIHDTMVTS